MLFLFSHITAQIFRELQQFFILISYSVLHFPSPSASPTPLPEGEALTAEGIPLPFFYLLTGNRKRSDLYRRTSYVNEALFDVVADLGYVIHHFVEVTAYDEERNGSVKLTVLDNEARRLNVERA